MITQAEVREYFRYEDGELYRTKPTNRSNKVGDKVGSYWKHTGYRRLSWKNKSISLHKAIWIYHNGDDINGEIDHINRVKDDNKIENLRCVSAMVNSRNRGIQSRNTSGVTGVSFNKAAGKWKVTISTDSGRKFLGYFGGKDEAIQTRKDAEKEHNYLEVE